MPISAHLVSQAKIGRVLEKINAHVFAPDVDSVRNSRTSTSNDIGFQFRTDVALP